jgi:lipopolysaccharide heptosyltransferase II
MKNLNNQIINKILLIRLSSLGDILLTTKTIRLIQKKFPHAKIDYCTSINFTDILKFNIRINRIIEYDKKKSLSEILKYKKYLQNTEDVNYDLVVDLQNNLRSRIFSFGLSNNILRVKKNRIRKLKIVHCKKRYKDDFSIVDNYNDTLHGMIDEDDDGLEFWLENDKKTNQYIPNNKHKNEKLKICVAPGATHFTKQWGKEKFSNLVGCLSKEYSAEIILLGNRSEIGICKYITDNNSQINLQDLSGKTSISEVASIISSADLMISNDSGLMHVAAARRIPLVAIFGSTVRDLGFQPYHTKYTIVETNINCRPCSHIGKAKCPKKHFKCMNKIEVNQVLKAIGEVLSFKKQ